MTINIYDNEDLFNVILLNGKISPGVVTLSGHNRRTNWDVKVSPFLIGGVTTYKGEPPIEFSATFRLIKDPSQGQDDFADWDKFVPTIEATVQGRTPKAVPIYHPDLARNKITSVVKAEIGGFVYTGDGSGATVTVKFQEYRPVRVYGGTIKGAGGDDPNEALKAQVKALTTQFQKTPWG